jgi:hypothetical protein
MAEKAEEIAGMLLSHTEKIQIYQPPNFNGWFHWATFLESGHFPM